ncbi:tetratricopeptide repeat protein [Palleronia abyssalis]|uniref:Uncharacterized protein n=1 Tax=Palleronia abyssalis TaxID=1501240 RepID=A0A2R8BX61_9RHOB|nr:hypothetical protein PAA8504_02595 [Palleronia abyssalis]
MRICVSILVLLLSSCTGALPDRPISAVPPGVDRNADIVDGLVVGHRLMEAGEYELARKAYLRKAAEIGMTADVLSALGATDLKLGRLGQAEDRFREAIEKDDSFVPALNNLGVVLMETGRVAEASLFFRAAFAADSGQSDDIRANLTRALSLADNSVYTPQENMSFALVRRGNGNYRLLSAT